MRLLRGSEYEGQTPGRRFLQVKYVVQDYGARKVRRTYGACRCHELTLRHHAKAAFECLKLNLLRLGNRTRCLHVLHR